MKARWPLKVLHTSRLTWKWGGARSTTILYLYIHVYIYIYISIYIYIYGGPSMGFHVDLGEGSWGEFLQPKGGGSTK